MKVHLFVISWNERSEEAEAIVREASAADYRTVIYSNAAETPETGTGEWIQVPNDYYFGRKFHTALELFESDADIFLLVQADAKCADWNQLIERCKRGLANPLVGVWGPNVSHTWWTNQRVAIQPTPAGVAVTQTDGIVFAFGRDIFARLCQMNYVCNNLGWGVEWAAICHAYANNRLVIRDMDVSVYHPAGSGYDHTLARAQQSVFLTQLTPQEAVQFSLLSQFSSRR